MLLHCSCCLAPLMVVSAAAPSADAVFGVSGYAMNPAHPTIQTHSARYLSTLIYFSLEPGEDGGVDQTRYTPEIAAALKKLRTQHALEDYRGDWRVGP